MGGGADRTLHCSKFLKIGPPFVEARFVQGFPPAQKGSRGLDPIIQVQGRGCIFKGHLLDVKKSFKNIRFINPLTAEKGTDHCQC